MKKILIAIFIMLGGFILCSCNKKEEKKNFEFNLSMDELKMRTDENHMIVKKFLDVDAKEYEALEDGDKKALKHLVKAANILEKIELRLDNEHNLEVLDWLNEEIEKGNEQAKLTKILFDAQKGVNAVDRMSNIVNLIKGIENLPGKGFYPEDLTKEEFHKILEKMLNENKIDEVRKILNQRSIVKRNGNELVAIDYVDYFKDEFEKMAQELEEASKVSTNKDFNEYMVLQAKALRVADPMIDAEADKKWATLQDTPLEFTITRECYDDEMTVSIVENEKLTEMLKKNNIDAKVKDNLGCRVGIVNKEGSMFLTSIKQYLPTLAKNMPYSDEYQQILSNAEDVKQTMVDVDIVALKGDVGSYRGGITLAENLPNDDKLSLTIGGGRRNVYHRQIRFITDKNEFQKRIDAILDESQHKYYNAEADHWFTLEHENMHSLGPIETKSELGQYGSIIEENKADMGSFAFLDLLVELGMFTEEQKKQIIVTGILDSFLKTKPLFSQAHRVRSIMQLKYIYDRGGFVITSEGKVCVNFDKVVSASRSMLEEIVKIQKDKNYKMAEKYVNDNFVWTDYMDKIAIKLNEVDKILNGRTEGKLEEKLLSE